MKSFKAVALALFGSFIEYYDYALYGFAAPILALHFFPKNDPTVVLLQAYGIFFAGSCSKPLGSLLFGVIGDRFGRAFALKLSILGIAIPTVMIGCLPDYHTLGWLAPCLLFLCRILQGIFVSGESDSARVFIFETLPKKYRCLANSLAYCLCMLGIYWASFSLSTLFSENSQIINQIKKINHLLTWVLGTNLEIKLDYWRLPFLLAGIFGILLFVLRQNLKETQTFLRVNVKPATSNNNHVLSIFRKTNILPILITLLMTGGAGGQYHFYFIFLPSYLSKILYPVEPQLAQISPTQYSDLLLLFAICLPLAGLMADKLSERFNLITLLKTSGLIILSLAIINILFIQQGHLPYPIMILTVIALSFAQANTFVVILDQFSVRERCRGASLGHSLGSLLFSGTAPFLSLWLWNFTEIIIAPFLYFLILCSISYFAILLLERKQGSKKAIVLPLKQESFP